MHDVLVVYTAAVASRVGGVEAMNAKARENIARTNKAYADSGVNVQLNLVGVRQVRNGLGPTACTHAWLPWQAF